MSDVENVIIIGSGPAGHTAAIYTARANLKPLMFEGFSEGGVPGGQLMITTEVENYPGFPEGVTGPELMAHFRKQSERFGTRIKTQDVTDVDFSKRPFRVTSEGQDYEARCIIIATGASARYLGLDSEKRLMNRGVSACATCDGALPMFRNQELVVVGGGDTAMEEASFLSRFASKVYLVHRREAFRASRIMLERVQKNEKIELLTPWVVDEVLGDDAVTGVRLYNPESEERTEKSVAGVFVAIGHTPNTALFSGKLDLEASGYIKTRGKTTYTSVEGCSLRAMSRTMSIARRSRRQVGGCQAAIDAERWLEGQG
ncbi:MAG: thioredoxin-disulfide reductase [Myxococcota bacterium]